MLRIKATNARLKMTTATERYAKHIVSLSNLNFKNPHEVLIWIKTLNRVFIKYNFEKDLQKVLTVFTIHGFHRNMCCYEDFDGENPLIVAQWMVGQCLEYIATQGKLPAITENYVQKWEEQFKIGKGRKNEADSRT
jgi:hypothetical protein